MFTITAPAEAAFVQTGSLLINAFPDTAGWTQAGAYGFVDGSDAADTPTADTGIEKYWMAVGTADGGSGISSPANPIQYFYFRIDHSSTAPDTKNFNVQLNLGAAAPGKVDHLLQMRATGTDAVSVRLSEYVTYPNLGAFTTGSMTLRESNLVGDGAVFKTGVLAKTGLWDATRYGFEVALPAAWITDPPASTVEVDGTGASAMVGAAFSTVGSFGAVATVKDQLSDAAGTFMNIVTNTRTGSSTVQPSGATQLAFATQPAAATAGATMSSVTVEIRDSLGALVTAATHEVTLSIGTNPGSGTLSGTLTVAAVSGVATFTTLSINNAGNGYTLVAAAPTLTSATSNAFNINAATTPTSIAASGGSSFSGVTAGATQVLSAIVRDGSSSPYPGYTVSWAVTAGGGSLSASSSITSGTGIASVTLTSGTAVGTNTVTATGSGLTGSPVTYTVTTVAGAATQIAAVTPSFSGVTASATQVLQAIVKDANNNVKSGVTVNWAVTAGGGSVSASSSVSGSDGIASITLTTGTSVGTNTATATASGLTGSPVTFTVTTVAGAATQIVAVTPSFSGVTAAGTQVLQAIVKDANNNVKSGVTVNWAVTAGGGSVSASSSVSGSDGIASITLTTGTAVGTNTATATSGSLTGSPVTFTVTTAAGAATQISAVTPSFSGVTAGSTQVLQAIVKDANNNPKSGVTVNWAVTAGGGSVSASSSVSGADGIASITLTTGTAVGTNTATATAAGLTGSPASFTVTTVAGPATQIAAVTPSFSGVTAGGTQSLQAIVKDANNNAVAGVTVSWAVTAGGGSVSASSSVSGSDGIASITLTTGTSVGTNTATASSGSLSGSPVTFTVTSVAGAATQIAAVTPSFSGVTAGGNQVLQALVRDANSNTKSGVTVNWAVTAGGGSVSATSSVTGSDGIASITFTTGTSVGTNTATASSGSLTGSPVTFTVTTVAGPATQIAAVQGSFGGVTAGATQILQAIVKDANNNVKSGVTVNWAVTAGGGSVSAGSSISGSDGIASITLTSGTSVGTNTATATVTGLTGSPVSFTVATVAGAATQIAAVQASFSGITVGGTQSLQALVKDANNNPVSGVTVNWAVTAGGGSVSAASSVSGSDGIASITFTVGTTVGTNTATATVTGLTGSPVTFTVTTVAGVATQIAAVQASFPGVTAGATQVLQAIAKDAYNNVVAGVTVNWAVTAGGGSVSAASSVTGSDGIASITLTSGTSVATNTATATVTGLTGSPVAFSVTTVAGVATQIAAVQASFTGVTAGATQVLQAIVKDANNNVKSGVTVSWAVTAGGGSVSAASSVSASDGIASITLTTGTNVGSNTASASSGSLSGSPVGFTVATVAGAATQIAAVQASFTGVNAGNTQVLQAIVKDANNNPKSGVTVNWAVTAGGGSVSTASSVSGSDGIAPVTLTTGATAGTNTATASSGSLTGSPVTFTVTTVASSATQIAAVQGSFSGVTSGATQVLQALVRDAGNNPVSGLTVTWAVTAGGGSLSGSTSVSGSDGIASITLTTGTSVGTNTVTATRAGLTGSPVSFTVTTVAGPATQIAAVQGSFTGLTAGGTQVLQVIARDVNNNVVAGVTVAWAVTAGGGSVSAASSVTGSDGIGSITLTSGTSVGTNTATATVSGLTGSPVSFTVTTVAGPATQIAAVQASFSGVTAGGPQSLQAIVKDANNNVKSGVTVTWAITAGGGSVSAASSVSGSDGIASVTFTTGTSVGTNTATASSGSLSGSPVTFTVTSVAAAATQIAAVTPSFSGVTAGATQILQAIVRDANSNPKSGVTVTWAVTGGGGSVSASSSVSGSDGVASITLTTGTSVGTNTATASSGTLTGSPVTFTVTAVAGAATQIAAVTPSFSGVTAGSTQVLQAIVKDANNNVKSGVTVSWAITAGGGSVSAASSVSGADGIASITLTTGTAVGTNTATATAAGLTGSPASFTVSSVAGVATQIAAVTPSFSGVTAGGTQSLQAIVKDANNNAVAGVTVSWAVTGGGGSVSASSSVSGSDGIASITLTTGTSGGTNTATASVSGLTGSPVSFSVATVAGPATQIAAVQATFTGVTVAGTQALQAVVKDANNNPKSGVTVSWAITAGGGSVSAASSVSGADGIASIIITVGTLVGSNTATATSSGLTGSPVSFSVATVAGAATQIAAVQATFTGVTAGNDQSLQARVRDLYGNAVSGVSVSWAVAAGGGSLSAAASTSGSDGIASIVYTTGAAAGVNTVTASSGSLAGSPVSFSVTTTPGTATQISAVQASFSSVTAGTNQVLQALVRDGSNNPVAGVTVTWAVVLGGGSLSAASSLSGSDGIASVTLTTGTLVATNTVTATRAGLSGSPITFSVVTVPGVATQISASPSTFNGVTAGASQAIEALARDVNGNPVAGVTVAWAVVLGGGSVSVVTSVTGSDGIARVTFTTGLLVGTNTATATVVGLAGSPITFTANTVAGVATQLTAVTASFSGVVVNTTRTLQARVRDANNNVVSGATVSWTVLSGGGSLSAVSSTSGSDGIASIVLRAGTLVGTNSARASLSVLTATFTLATVPDVPAQLIPVQSSFTNVPPGTSQSLQVTLKDQFGNVIPGQSLSWAVTAGGGSLSTPTSTTAADGKAGVTVTTGSTAVQNNVTVSIGALTATFTLSPPATVGFTVTPTGGSTVVNESGTADTIGVVLVAAPSSNVVISVTSNRTREASVTPSQLTFTPANWNVVQNVTVRGVEEFIVDGTQSVRFTFSIVDASSAAAYASVADQSVVGTVTDNDVLGTALTVVARSFTGAPTGVMSNFSVAIVPAANLINLTNVAVEPRSTMLVPVMVEAVQLAALPAGTPSPPSMVNPGILWEMGFMLEDRTSVAMDEARIEFFVSYAWQNTSCPAVTCQVRLFHYAAGAWEIITPTVLYANATGTVYQAAVTSFSPFAVGGVARGGGGGVVLPLAPAVNLPIPVVVPPAPAPAAPSVPGADPAPAPHLAPVSAPELAFPVPGGAVDWTFLLAFAVGLSAYSSGILVSKSEAPQRMSRWAARGSLAAWQLLRVAGLGAATLRQGHGLLTADPLVRAWTFIAPLGRRPVPPTPPVTPPGIDPLAARHAATQRALELNRELQGLAIARRVGGPGLAQARERSLDDARRLTTLLGALRSVRREASLLVPPQDAAPVAPGPVEITPALLEALAARGLRLVAREEALNLNRTLAGLRASPAGDPAARERATHEARALLGLCRAMRVARAANAPNVPLLMEHNPPHGANAPAASASVPERKP